MKAIIDYRADRDDYAIYMGGVDASIYLRADGTRHIEPHTVGHERPIFVRLASEEYYALRDAILERESPRLAEASLLTDVVKDTREVRDRLLTMLEGTEA